MFTIFSKKNAKNLPRAFMVGSTGFAKLGPIMCGLYISRFWGEGVYSSYVVALSLAGFVSSFSTLGSGPQILRSGADESQSESIKEKVSLALCIGFLSCAVYFFYWFFFEKVGHGNNAHETYKWFYSIALLSLGVLMSGLSVAILNSLQKWVGSGVVIIFPYFISFFAIAFFLGPSSIPSDFVIVFYSGVFMLASSITLFYATNKAGVAFISMPVFTLQSAFKHGRVAFFGVVYLFGIYWIAKIINEDYPASESASFSIGLQFFALSIFVPSILGSVVIPLFSRVSTKESAFNKKKTIKLVFCYFAISIFFAFIVYCSLDLVFYVYKIKEGSKFIVIAMQLSAIFGAMSAAFTQRLIIRSEYNLLVVGAILWLSVLVFSVGLAEKVESVVLGFVFAYAILVIYHFLIFSFAKNVKNTEGYNDES